MHGQLSEALPKAGLRDGSRAPIALAVLALMAVTLALLTVGSDRAEAIALSAPPYLVKDSNEAGGLPAGVPAANGFVDISTTGTRLTFFDADALPTQNANADDGVALSIPLPFEGGQGFDFYGNRFTAVNMSTNGFLHFSLNGFSDSLSNNCPVANAAEPNNMIAPLWDDLVLRNPPSTISGGFVQTFGAAPNRVTIFQWDNVDHFGGGVDSFDFEAMLFETSNAIEFHYSSVAPSLNPEAGSGSTTGIENATATNSANYACDTNNSITPGLAVRFFRPSLGVTRAGTGLGSVAGTAGLNPAGGPPPPDQAISCPPTCSDFFDAEGQVTLTPTPAAGSVFAGFSGACTGTGPCVIPMNANKAVTATFTDKPSLGVALAGTGSGAVVSSPAGINCPTACTTETDPDASVTLAPTAAAGSVFTGFSGACTGTGPCVIQMDADKTVAATFTLADTIVQLDLSGAAKQKLKKLAVSAGCGAEACTVDASGTVSAKPSGRAAMAKAKTFTLAPVSASAGAGQQAKLALKVKRGKPSKELAALLADGGKATAAIDAQATDAAGNKAGKSLSVKLKP